MPYATLQDLIDRFTEAEMIQLTDTTRSGLVDMTPIDRALADADAEIDGVLVGRYALPVAQVPDLLVRVAADLARESLYIHHPTETVTERAKTARQILKGIASGATRLELAPAQASSSVQGLVEMVSGRWHSPFGG